jgi:hypothetical protein
MDWHARPSRTLKQYTFHGMPRWPPVDALYPEVAQMKPSMEVLRLGIDGEAELRADAGALRRVPGVGGRFTYIVEIVRESCGVETV